MNHWTSGWIIKPVKIENIELYREPMKGESTSTTAKNAKQSTYGAAIRACALQRRNSGWATFALKSLCYHNRSMDANIKLYNQMAFFLTVCSPIILSH